VGCPLPRAGVGAVVGTGVVTLFHSSIVKLAKTFLDPFGNEDGHERRESGAAAEVAIGISIQTLLQETNIGSERWRKGGCTVPEVTRTPQFDVTAPSNAEAAARAALNDVSELTGSVSPLANGPEPAVAAVSGGSSGGASTVTDDAAVEAAAEAVAFDDAAASALE